MSRCTCNDPTHFHPGEEAGYWLFPLIDVPKTTALNERTSGSVRSVFRPYEQRLDVSSTGPLEGEDGEVIIIIPFTETVKIKSFQVIPVNEDTAPRRITIYANRDDIDFNNAADIKPLQIVENVAADFEGLIDNPLIPSKFSGVDKLIMHIRGPSEDELVQIASLGFKGESRGLNKKVIEGLKYEVRAQLKDHTSTRADKSSHMDIS